MTYLKTTWDNISLLGCASDKKDERLNRKVKLTNQIVFVASIMSLVQALILYSVSVTCSLICVTCAVIYSLTWLFNYKEWFTFSRLYFCFSTCLALLISGSVLSEDMNTSARMIMIQAFIVPLVVFDITEMKIMLIGLAFYFAMFIGFDPVNSMLPVLQGIDPSSFNSPESVVVNGVLCMITLFIGFRYLQRLNFWAEVNLARALNTSEVQKQELEIKSKDIQDGIEYANRIQMAVLPKQEEICSMIPEHFIYFKPKETIGGDFFWYGEHNEHVLIACVDCTGHGTPGALISIVGSKLMDKIVKDWGVTDPGEILNLVNLEMISTLRNEYSEVKDGMDISIVSVDCEKKKVTFAGAKNSLLISRNDSVIRIKGDRASIGEHHIIEEGFSTHEVQLEDGDTFYMHSDGVTDQFGGPRNRKFMNHRLSEVIKDVVDDDMTLQKAELMTRIDSWRGDVEQIDDILVIGFRLDIEYMHKLKKKIPVLDFGHKNGRASQAS